MNKSNDPWPLFVKILSIAFIPLYFLGILLILYMFYLCPEMSAKGVFQGIAFIIYFAACIIFMFVAEYFESRKELSND